MTAEVCGCTQNVPFLLPSKVCLAFHLSAPSITSTFLRKLVLRGKCLPHPLAPTSGRWEGSFRTSRWLSHLKSKLDPKAFFHRPPADGAAALSPCSAESLEASETQTQEETGLGPHTEPQRGPVRGQPCLHSRGPEDWAWTWAGRRCRKPTSEVS